MLLLLLILAGNLLVLLYYNAGLAAGSKPLPLPVAEESLAKGWSLRAIPYERYFPISTAFCNFLVLHTRILY
ncbi:MAG: hypothetical protein ACRDHZ_17940, partial [Ktedonobacteraceae bacterium]